MFTVWVVFQAHGKGGIDRPVATQVLWQLQAPTKASLAESEKILPGDSHLIIFSGFPLMIKK
jgi:hypothetical protein